MIRVGEDLFLDPISDSDSSASEVLDLVYAMPLLSLGVPDAPLLAICDYDPQEYYEMCSYPDASSIDGDDHWDPEELALPIRTVQAIGKAHWMCNECKRWTTRAGCF